MSATELEIIKLAIAHLEAEARACYATGNATPAGITDALGLLRAVVGGG